MEWCKVKLIELDDRAIVNRKINRGTLCTNIKGISDKLMDLRQMGKGQLLRNVEVEGSDSWMGLMNLNAPVFS